MSPTGRPPSITFAAIALAIGGLVDLELTRRVMFKVLEILGPPPLEHRPLALLVFVSGIALWALMLLVAAVAALAIVSAGRVLRGHAWSRFEGLGAATLGAVLAVAASSLGVFGAASTPILSALLLLDGVIAASLLRGGQWFEPTPRPLALWVRKLIPIEIESDD